MQLEDMLDHPALVENPFKDIPRLSDVRLSIVSDMFRIAHVEDFSPDGDREGKNIPWPTISRAVLLRDDYRCRVCGKGNFSSISPSDPYDKVHFDIEVHHIIPRKDGGSDTFQNLISLCSECHHNTYSNSYSGVPVKNTMSLFEFEKRIYLAIPPESTLRQGEVRLPGFLKDYRRIFNEETGKHTIVPVRGAKIPIEAISLTIEQYRKTVLETLHILDVRDFRTMIASFARKEEKCRFLVDNDGNLLV